MSGSEQFDRAREGFADGDRYERARPGYPADAVGFLCETLGIGPGVRVVDVAAGTGKLTRALVAAGAAVTAVEPVAGMRDALRSLPGVPIVDGHAEALPLGDGSADVATVAQAFHWFDGPMALRELARVLAPGGRLGLMWNVMDRSVPWVDRLQDVIHRHRGPHPWYAGHAWRAAFDANSGFAPLEHRAFRNLQPIDPARLRDRVSSISFIATLDEPTRARVLDEAAVVLPSGVDGLPYVTDVFWTRRSV